MSGAPPASPRVRLAGWHCIVLAWLAAYATRPLLLGFYDDDWAVLLIPAQQTAAFSWPRLAHRLTLYANRPGNGLITCLLSSFCGESAWLWHAAIAGLALLSALAVRALCRELLRFAQMPDRPAADLAACLWLLFPWTMGITAWPTVCPALASLSFFALSGTLLLAGWRSGRPRTVPATLLFLASCLTYEFFYGQFLVLIAIGLLCAARDKTRYRQVRNATLALAGVQLAAITWNRLVPLFNQVAPSKTFYPLWWQAALNNLRRLPDMIGHSTAEVSPTVEWLLLVGLMGWLLLWGLRVRRADGRPPARRELALAAACAFGVLLSIGVISLVNHRLKGLGLGSRTTTAVSLWLTGMLAVGLAAVPHRLRYARAAYVLVLAGLLAVSTHARIGDWAGAWRLQQKILAATPITDLAHAQPGSVVLFFGPHEYRGVRVFGATWNLNRAMAYTYPAVAHLRFCEAREDRLTTWDGRRFEQRLRVADARYARRTVWNQFEAPEVWVWEYGSPRAHPVQPPFIHPLETARP